MRSRIRMPQQMKRSKHQGREPLTTVVCVIPGHVSRWNHPMVGTGSMNLERVDLHILLHARG
jgi:hypothetical protein